MLTLVKLANSNRNQTCWVNKTETKLVRYKKKKNFTLRLLRQNYLSQTETKQVYSPSNNTCLLKLTFLYFLNTLYYSRVFNIIVFAQ